MVGDEAEACGFAARFRFVASLLACCAGKRFAFPQLRTLSGSNPSARCPNKNGPLSRTVIKQMVGDEGYRVRLAPPASAAALRALRAALENACAFPQLRTLSGSNPMHGAQKRKAPIAGSLIKQMVGDEGFEPPALCV